MKIKKYFTNNNLITNNNLPKSYKIDSFINSGYPFIPVILLSFLILILLGFFIILEKLNFFSFLIIKDFDSLNSFLVYIIILITLFVFYYFFFFIPKSRLWDKIKTNNWFRNFRLYDLLSYLESKKINDIEIKNVKSKIFHTSLLLKNNNIFIDYCVDLINTSPGYVGNKEFDPIFNKPLNIQELSDKCYSEYSHFFKFYFNHKKFKRISNTIYFYGKNRDNFESHRLKFYQKDTKNVFAKFESNNTDVVKLVENIENIINQASNLKGEINIANGKIVVKLYDSIDYHFKDYEKKNSYEDFLKNNSTVFSFENFEKLFTIFK